MKIIAVDPGYDRVGIAIIEKCTQPRGPTHEQWVHSETFQTNPDDSLHSRIFAIGDRISMLCKQYNIEYLAIEKLFFTNNQKTVMGVSEARGAIIYAAMQYCGTHVAEYTPLQIKVAVTGNGRADKRSVIQMTEKLITIPEKTDGTNRLDDEYDAIACGLTFFAYHRP